MKACARFLILLSLLGLAACARSGAYREAHLAVGGDAARGRADLENYGCGACHTIPGVRGSRSLVGPPLTGIASRLYIAGVLPNSPDNMERWIRNPPAVDSLTVMPNFNVSETDARDITTYLYTLK